MCFLLLTGKRPAGYAGAFSTLSHWVFDYSFTPFGKYRFGDNPNWIMRQAFEGHLYAPGVNVYEDTNCNTTSVFVHSISILFTHGEASGLLPLIKPAGYVRFFDPRQLLCPLLERFSLVTKELDQATFWTAQGLLREIFMLLQHVTSTQHPP